MRQELVRQGQSPLRIDEDEVRTSKKPQAASRNDSPENAVQAALKRPKRRKEIESPCFNPNAAFKPLIGANLRCWQTFPNWLRGKNLPAPFPLRASGISGDERRLAVSTSAVGFKPALSSAKVCFPRRVSNGRRASLIFAPCLVLSVWGSFCFQLSAFSFCV